MTLPKNTTAKRILDVTQDFIQTWGYSAISINDIARQVGIKKPSVIHHFPSKAALGMAVVKRYREVMSTAMEQAFNQDEKAATAAIEFYFTPYIRFAETCDKVCLCGALAGEFTALPVEIQREVTQFFDEHLLWLNRILATGLGKGEFHFSEAPSVLAQLILDSLQGALIVKRATRREDHLRHAIESIRQRLGMTT